MYNRDQFGQVYLMRPLLFYRKKVQGHGSKDAFRVAVNKGPDKDFSDCVAMAFPGT